MKQFGMACHQALSFHSLMMRIPKTEVVFWPGCALMMLDPGILQKTLAVLRRAEPEIQLAAGCCGQPSQYLFPEQFEKRRDKLRNFLQQQGVKRIYTACPNCTLQLRQLDGFEIIPVWPVLAEDLEKADVELPAGRFVWHDPCPTRGDAAQQAGVRQLLNLSCCDWAEPEYTGTHTRCCGNFHMLRSTDPEKSAMMRSRRLKELGEGTILSSCEGCLDAFRTEGRETCHLLELLFGRSKSRSWGNRFHTTRKTPID